MLNYHFKQLNAYKVLVSEYNQMVAGISNREITLPKQILKAIRGTVVENYSLHSPVDHEQLLDTFTTYSAILKVQCNVQETLERLENSNRKLSDSEAQGLKLFKSMAKLYDFIFGWYIHSGTSVFELVHSDPEYYQALD